MQGTFGSLLLGGTINFASWSLTLNLDHLTFDKLWWTWSWHSLFNSLFIKFVLSHPSFSRLSKKFEVNIFYVNRTLWHTPISKRREKIKLFLFYLNENYAADKTSDFWWDTDRWVFKSPSQFLHVNKVSTPSEQELPNQIADWISEYCKNFSRICLPILVQKKNAIKEVFFRHIGVNRCKNANVKHRISIIPLW